MAFTGCHIVNFYCGTNGPGGGGAGALPRHFLWSETLSAAGAFTNKVKVGGGTIDTVLRIRTSVDAYFAYVETGTPDPVGGTRMFVPANQDYDIYVPIGASFAWAAA